MSRAAAPTMTGQFASDEILDAIVRRPYTRMLIPDEDGSFTALVLEFPGAITEGANPTEAMCRLDEVLGMIVDVMLEDGQPIPEPLCLTEYSGRVNLRIPPSLHRECAKLAAIEGVSLNRFFSDAISRHVGALTASAPAPQRSKRAASRPRTSQ